MNCLGEKGSRLPQWFKRASEIGYIKIARAGDYDMCLSTVYEVWIEIGEHAFLRLFVRHTEGKNEVIDFNFGELN